MIGIRKAKKPLLSGDWVFGQEAERIGLVNKAVPVDRFEQEAIEFAAKFASKALALAKLIKESVN